MPTFSSPSTGIVYLVGAGPGDPRLITLRGAECLRAADVVLYDYLANPLILEHARPETELLCCGKHGDGALMPQEEINRRLVALASAGRCVVRLKGGDPAVFARGAEEIAALRAAGIRYEVVPGITAAQAAACYAEIPITHRDLASAVALVAGQRQCGKPSDQLDFASLARFPGTLVFYMGVTTAAEWTARLIEAGLAAETPTAILRRLTWPDQQDVRCTLAEVPDEIAARRMRPPVVVVVGRTVGTTAGSDWFSARKLFGRTVLVTRPQRQAEDIIRPLSDLGARCLRQPAIEIAPPKQWGAVDDALARIAGYDWLVFSSANGVRFLLDRLLAEHGDLRRLAGVRIAAIGDKTAEVLREYHLRSDLIPEQFRAESLSAALLPSAAGRRFLLARAGRGREVLAEELSAAGGAVDQIVVYESLDILQPDPEIVEELQSGRIDWITVTSSAIARSLAGMFGESLGRAKLVSISPITSETLQELGFSVSAEATEYTCEGVVAALLAAAQKSA